MTKRIVVIALLAVALVLAFVFWREQQRPRIPSVFIDSISPECGQVALVLSPNASSEQARMWLLERGQKGEDDWYAVAGPIAVTLGHKGLAWGVGEHKGNAPDGFPIKREGDKCSPAGVFRIPVAFGLAEREQAGWLRLPYIPLTPSIIGVDDPNSKYYNQIVDNTQVERDWDSNEPMMRHDRLYEWGAMVGHNPAGRPGGGSCIFLHLWPAPGKGTSGCTAMSAEDLRALLAWLDPAREPRIVQGLEGW